MAGTGEVHGNHGLDRKNSEKSVTEIQPGFAAFSGKPGLGNLNGKLKKAREKTVLEDEPEAPQPVIKAEVKLDVEFENHRDLIRKCGGKEVTEK